MQKRKYVWGALRIILGLIFLWSFFDKTFGLGYATTPDKAWIAGGSPTFGFLSFATKGPLASLFQALAGQAWVDWLFMLGLLLIGAALVAGVLVRIASLAGALLMFLMWIAVLPPQNNPLFDQHVIYILILIGFAVVHAGRYMGCGTKWCHTDIVRKYPWLE